MNKVAEIISTVFYVGRIPLAPGTICSFLAFLSWYYLRFYIEGVFILYGSLILFFIGVAVSTIYSESIKKEDPPEVVIDEWVGQWIALWMIPHSFAWGFLSFTIFRIFDILKLRFSLKFFGLESSSIGKIAKFFRKLNLVFFTNRYF